MPFLLKVLTGHALACFLLVLFAVWKLIAGHPVIPSLVFALIGIYIGLCGVLFLVRWKYARELYLGYFLMSVLYMMLAGTNLFLFFIFLVIALPIALYLYKASSVSKYFSLSN